MANQLCRNIFLHLRIRFLHSSATLFSSPPLPSTSATSSSSFTVDFLVNSCGLPLKSAQSVSKKLQLNDKTLKQPQSVLQFLKSHHFSDTHVTQLIVKRPQILNCRIHNNLKPKFDYLVQIGFEGELLPRTILSNPSIVGDSLDSQIKPNVQFLRLFLDSHEKFLMAVKRGPWLLSENSKTQVQPKVDVLMKEGGVPAHVVQRLLTLHPRCIFHDPEKLVRAVNSVKNLGFQPTDLMFIQAFRVKLQMSELTWKNKIEVMKGIGFSEGDILKAFKRFPSFLGLSEDNTRKKLHFYFNTMKLEPQAIIVNPNLLGYSIEKRIRPRYQVLKVLKSKKLIRGINKVQQLGMSEENFQDKYIDQFINEVPGLLEFYLGIKEGKSSVLDGEEISETRLQHNVDLLMKEGGLPAHAVQSLLTSHPRYLFQTLERLISAVNSVKDLGFEPSDTMFIHAFRVKIQMIDSTWNKKIDLMRSMIFSEEDILKAFKGFPLFLAYSEENIRKTMNFYFNTMELEPHTIFISPVLLGFSIEKRARPRYHVLKVLESTKLIKGNKKLEFLRMNEEKFQEKYIENFIDEIPGLLEFYLGIKDSKSSVLDSEEVILRNN